MIYNLNQPFFFKYAEAAKHHKMQLFKESE